MNLNKEHIENKIRFNEENVYSIIIHKKLCNKKSQLTVDNLLLILEIVSLKFIEKNYKCVLTNVENDLKVKSPISVDSNLLIKCRVENFKNIIIYTNIEIYVNGFSDAAVINSSHSYLIKSGFQNTKLNIKKENFSLKELKYKIKL
ncbi:hypothetical protein DICPUDRAFT_76718 [Dictyostelium purpureum]|uniref:Uncharacterized protein n=1 Tax=Dictyostelium purpureum TaxID=5786 RepID=F0ZEF2_DICPU|nr:uncharacterized protein DICPUDRAFT_76718 [Dictyostelium purpureum]EGC37683.1 hypothetical protein DICPUDRAFT_76718 [Dictyostelium purpureum]|eukprot:XP_003285787.1 hypothetical protein DICPUDRAFT_76718 [Dictyostelium purpureum]